MPHLIRRYGTYVIGDMILCSNWQQCQVRVCLITEKYVSDKIASDSSWDSASFVVAATLLVD
jgi:hypothetical protein